MSAAYLPFALVENLCNTVKVFIYLLCNGVRPREEYDLIYLIYRAYTRYCVYGRDRFRNRRTNGSIPSPRDSEPPCTIMIYYNTLYIVDYVIGVLIRVIFFSSSRSDFSRYIFLYYILQIPRRDRFRPEQRRWR